MLRNGSEDKTPFLYIKQGENENNRIKNIVLLGFGLRIIILIYILTIGRSFSTPYYVFDDQNYELLAQKYLQYAQQAIDIPALSTVRALNYLEIFWPCFICISAKTFGFIYAGRVFNCFFSAACIKTIYSIMCLLTDNEKTRLLPSKLFAFLPLSAIVCCFPIKDIFLMYGVLKIFHIIQMWHDDVRVNKLALIWAALLFLGISRTRGAIIESLLIITCVMALHKFYKKGQSLFAVSFSAVLVICIFLFGNDIFSSFRTKVDDYSAVMETGNRIKYIQMNSILELYKLPASYFYATLQPFLLDFFTRGRASYWVYIMGILNISIYPIAIGNLVYAFLRKHSIILWISTTALMAGISALSLGNSRHYLFCLPYTMINFSLAIESEKKWIKQVVLYGSIGIFAVIFIISII